MKKAIAWWGIAALIIIIVNMLSCVSSQTSVSYANIVPAAQTSCDENTNKPIIIFNVNLKGTPAIEELRIHEEVHVAQMRAYKGGCKAAWIRYGKDRAFAYRQELEAYCAQVRYEVNDAENPDEVLARAIVFIANTVGRNRPFGSVEQDMRECVKKKPPTIITLQGR